MDADRSVSRIKCLVPSCRNSRNRNPKLSFHTFPKINTSLVGNITESGLKEKIDRYKAWNIELKLHKSPPRAVSVCYLHFKRDDFLLPVNLLMLVNGALIIWTSPVLSQLKSNNPKMNPLGERITTIQIAVLAGLPSFISLFGPPSFGKLADVIGRKNTLICISVGVLISNIAVAFGTHIYVYYIGRSITSLCLSLLFIFLPIYLNEICEDHNRAKHGCLMMFFIPLGSLYGYLVGPISNVRVFTLLCVAPLIPQLICFSILVPESPFYTASKGDKETTVQILKRLRNNKSSEEIEEDFAQIEATLKTRSTAINGGFKQLFKTRALRRGFIIGFGSCLVTHLSGAPIVMAFLGPIFNDAGTNISGNSVAILAGTVKLIFFFVTMTVVGRLGRRPLLLFSSIGTGITLAILGVYFYLNKTKSPVIDTIRWLPVMCILIYIATYSLGLGSIPMSVLSELFPNDIRSVATSFTLTLVGIFTFVLSTTFPLVSDLLGVHYCIGMFSVGCVLGFIFLYFMLPETKGRSFLEIQDILNR